MLKELFEKQAYFARFNGLYLLLWDKRRESVIARSAEGAKLPVEIINSQ